MEEITMKVEMTDEVKQKIKDTVQEAVDAALAEISADLTRLNLLAGQLNGDITAATKRLAELQGIRESLDGKIKSLAKTKGATKTAE